MDKKTLKAQLEALLFLHGEPMSISQIAKILKTDQAKLKKALGEMKDALKNEDRGLSIVLHDEKVQLTTSPELSSLLEHLTKEELDTKLTPANLETLSIIAYLGPCSRALIEHIRGVNSSFILRSLTIRGLIERSPDPERSNAYIYQPTFEFLNHMGISTQDDLPKYEKYRDIVKSFFEENGQAHSDN
ncbi:MAG: SMC-Scp complex subunit ScpB [Candidatus Colwellbacteria bacterium CG10_big_fil_rev_8_21_14_0_10_42_22]|uniref:SMC-Scp complex subunit ScpB n=1 Tax=Candidatus Colwellbacteria bacterium CG10_big_fil_rev_8_21_14_0_10_42_22 TaxID=1974540 RepID=A0A2H0VFF8_9BACT|nr:MAG: SMC-Scp complex subunit ScpB [Candidatus Colwellbacteria bacterium CG10_big_fil_rev_8_21_14_0_10_42_22]